MSSLLRNISIRRLLLVASLIILLTMVLNNIWRSEERRVGKEC